MPVATSKPELPFERAIAEMAIHRAFDDAEDKKSPIVIDDPIGEIYWK